MSDDPRLAIIGAGNLSTKRIYPYIGHAGAQLVGVCDLDADKAATNARRFGGKAYTDIDAMLDAEKPDGVIICVGPAAHAQLAKKVLLAGYPVYTEKPPATTAADAVDVARVARETGLLCMTAFKKRYNVAYSRARQWLDKFDADDHAAISIDYCSGPFENTHLERMFLFDFTVHILDLVGYLFGDVAQVFAFAKGPNAYAVSLRFVSGAVGSLCLSDGRSFGVPTEEVEITVRGGNFMTIHNSSVYRITENQKPVEWREPTTFVSGGDSGNDTGHFAEIVAYVAALRQGETHTRSSIDESYKCLALYEAIVTSAERGAAVPVAYADL
ncbi:MAG: Gfo/Idh/MocA family oxidoreductase [Phycisphaeraceae bacterium]